MPHYFDPEQKSKANIQEVKADIFDNELILKTASGVFSKDHIDKGTLVLLSYADIKNSDNILDIGCGYGVVGISIAKAFRKNVTMSDVNKRAIMLSRKNAKLNNVDVNIIESNLFENIDGSFDTILSNPPQHAGKDICISIIEQSLNHLNEGGTLQLVARHKKGGKSLSEKMEEVFGNVDVLGIKSGFRVYISKKK